jgi:hypothetical protein
VGWASSGIAVPRKLSVIFPVMPRRSTGRKLREITGHRGQWRAN